MHTLPAAGFLKTLAGHVRKSSSFPSSNFKKLDIAIVGNGTSGASLACALGRSAALKDFRIGLISPYPEVPTVQTVTENRALRVVALANKSVRFLKDIGAWDRIPSERATPVHNMEIWDRDNWPGVLFDSQESRVEALAHIVETPMIVSAAHECIRELPNVEIIGHGLVTSTMLANRDQKRVIETAGGPIEATLVVAADGGKSKLRDLCDIKINRVDYQRFGVVSALTVEGNVDMCTSYQRFLATGPIALLPLGPELLGDSESRALFSLVWTLPTGIAKKIIAMPKEDLAACVEACINLNTDEVNCIMKIIESGEEDLARHLKWRKNVHASSVDESSEKACFSITPAQGFPSAAGFPLAMQHAVSYHAPRLALLGDAAHVIHPLAGQGLNMGLADAAELCKVIERAAVLGQDIGATSTLEAYEKDRKIKNKMMLMSCDLIHCGFGLESAVLSTLRREGMRIFDTIAPIKRLATRLATEF